ncbi:hypothetical protein [Neobacillus dielmonensis]|nr:hypothetical protein [Neobacillus dielmonensis]
MMDDCFEFIADAILMKPNPQSKLKSAIENLRSEAWFSWGL